MSPFLWQDQYQLGDLTIDQQHRELFSLANQLVHSSDQTKLTQHAMHLYQHVRKHFTAEEIFMKKQGYPDYQKHVEAHDRMLDKLVTVSEKINRNEWHQADVESFMREWISHIVKEDATVACAKDKL